MAAVPDEHRKSRGAPRLPQLGLGAARDTPVPRGPRLARSPPATAASLPVSGAGLACRSGGGRSYRRGRGWQCLRGVFSGRPTRPGTAFEAAAAMGCEGAVLIGWGGAEGCRGSGSQKTPSSQTRRRGAIFDGGGRGSAGAVWLASRGGGAAGLCRSLCCDCRLRGSSVSPVLLVSGRPWTLAADACRRGLPRCVAPDGRAVW